MARNATSFREGHKFYPGAKGRQPVKITANTMKLFAFFIVSSLDITTTVFGLLC
jgi:hypothetical protein